MVIKTNPIYPKRAIKQCDLISPYIFVIRTEYLGRYIYFAVTQPKSDIGLKLHKDSLNIRI